MRRFPEDSDDAKFFNGYFSDNDEDDDDDEGEEVVYSSELQLVNALQFELAKRELDHHLLEKAMEIAQRSWFWRFRSEKSKMKKITFVYSWLQEMIEDEDEPEEDTTERD